MRAWQHQILGAHLRLCECSARDGLQLLLAKAVQVSARRGREPVHREGSRLCAASGNKRGRHRVALEGSRAERTSCARGVLALEHYQAGDR